MRAVTIREAKARLNELVEAATRGEQVVLMRGSRHVAAIVALSAEELELPPRLTDPQAERLWQLLAAERREGRLLEFAGPEEAVAHLEQTSPPRRPSRAGAAKKRGRPA
jgi:prevent-host-death family protein